MKYSPFIAIVTIFFTFAWIPSKSKAFDKTKTDSLIIIENEEIAIGINLKLGGAISFIASPTTGNNIVNNYDWGRQIQMSFYGYPKSFRPDGKQPHNKWKNLGWNPIQSGDVYGYRSKVLDYNKSENSLYVKSRPMHWPLRNQSCECTFETWIKLENNTAKVRSRINNYRSDQNQYPARMQELPAIYNNAPFWKLMTYRGDKPFTSDSLSRIPKKEWDEKGPWRSWLATERWAASINNNNWGLGVWTPEHVSYIGGFAGELGTDGGTYDYPTAYISPLNEEILDHNITYEYTYTLILGSVKEIRNHVYEHADKNYTPNYVFEKNRQHWTHQSAHDQGWPIEGSLKITLDSSNAMILGPTEFWDAEDASRLTMEAAFETQTDSVTLFWKTYNQQEFSNGNSLSIPIKSGGEFHTYNINMESISSYKGGIIQIALKPKGKTGDSIELRSVIFK